MSVKYIKYIPYTCMRVWCTIVHIQYKIIMMQEALWYDVPIIHVCRYSFHIGIYAHSVYVQSSVYWTNTSARSFLTDLWKYVVGHNFISLCHVKHVKAKDLVIFWKPWPGYMYSTCILSFKWTASSAYIFVSTLSNYASSAYPPSSLCLLGLNPGLLLVFALTVRVATTWHHVIHTWLPGLIHFPNSINISPDSLHLFYVGVPSYARYF